MTALAVVVAGSAVATSTSSANPIPNALPVSTARDGLVQLRLAGELIPLAPTPSRSPPVGLKLIAAVKMLDGEPTPPALSEASFALSPRIGIDMKGLPSCGLGKLLGRSEREGLQACGDARIGSGEIVRRPHLREQGEFVMNDPVVAFNGFYEGRRAIFVDHFPRFRYDNPYVIAFTLKKAAGRGGYSLTAVIPPAASTRAGHAGFPLLELTLRREFNFRGIRHSYLTASCPASGTALFNLATAAFDLEFVVSHPPDFELGEELSLSGPIRGKCPV